MDTNLPDAEYLSAEEVMEYLLNHGIKISKSCLYNLDDFGNLESIKIGRRVFYKKESVIALINPSSLSIL